MKNFIKNPSDINRIEYWAATTMFVFSIFFLVSGSVNMNEWKYNKVSFTEAQQEYTYFNNYFLPSLVRYITFYGSYLLLSFFIVPPLSRRENITLNVLLTLVIFYLISVILAVTVTWLQGYLFSSYTEDQLYAKLFQESAIFSFWLLMMFALYNFIKHIAIYLLENSDLIQSKYRVITRDGIYAFIVWMIGLFLLLMSQVESDIVLAFASCPLAGIILYCYSMYILLPGSQRAAKPYRSYLGSFSWVALLSSFSIFVVLLILTSQNNEEISFTTAFFNLVFQLLFTAPLSWYVYKHRITVDYEIKGLQTALGRSTADLNFLRSQINPHFLFNILNALYGTSLQENAERTSEGIQKLGDMMRFMLHENLQEKISLNREIEYLNNYIALQSLRTQSSPEITISTEIEEHVGILQIAPMLLIPFVENAFKHGISLKERSNIRISLVNRDKTLYFDISNSMHEKPANDPEKNNNGIGLSNVKQRLRLMYPTRHELSIRESGKEFFVHLTIQLD
ncbi:sensor histidine kinase [Daejeonella sp.]|uniref:sensor histidine kinase n=1 Tax=Daejeonella sp. TaxID=2805397 RepID=UPI003983A73C